MRLRSPFLGLIMWLWLISGQSTGHLRSSSLYSLNLFSFDLSRSYRFIKLYGTFFLVVDCLSWSGGVTLLTIPSILIGFVFFFNLSSSIYWFYLFRFSIISSAYCIRLVLTGDMLCWRDSYNSLKVGVFFCYVDTLSFSLTEFVFLFCLILWFGRTYEAFPAYLISDPTGSNDGRVPGVLYLYFVGWEVIFSIKLNLLLLSIRSPKALTFELIYFA